MIGHQLNGFTILAAAPDSNFSLAILAKSNEDTYEPWVTSSVDMSQMPLPTSWGQGHYCQTLEDAAKDYLGRLKPNGVAAAYLNAEEWAKELAVFTLALDNLSTYLLTRRD